MMPAIIRNLTNARFGRLIALSPASPEMHTRTLWHCICDCGKPHKTRAAALVGGLTKSCGCLQRDTVGALNRIHGKIHAAEYNSWAAMRGRCNNPKNQDYASYGGRGLTVCDRWGSFENFLADMGQKPSPQHSIDRVNNDAGYSPDNCRWATKLEQRHNQRKPTRKQMMGL